MRTRAAASGSIGESGIYEFENRTIDKLYYGIYSGASTQIIQIGEVTREDTNPFKVVFKLESGQTADNTYLFFWAGNTEDKIKIIAPSGFTSNNVSDPIFTITYSAFTVNLSEKFIDGDFKAYDSFAGYYHLSEISNNNKNISVTLHRPFAEVHILTDDFIPSETNIYRDFTDGATIITGLAASKPDVNGKGLFINNYWNYKNNNAYSSDIVRASFNNNLEGDTPYRTTFKERPMDYIGCFYTFPSDNYTKYINFGVNKGINNPTIDNKTQFVSVALPEGGIKANNKYVIYNQKRSEGGTGFLEDPYYVISVQNDNTWEDTNISDNGENRAE